MVFRGSNHTKIPMVRFTRARFTLRLTTASALAFTAIAAACLVPNKAWAQESDRPFGLFDKIFGGSERVGGERNPPPAGAAPAGADRTAQISGPDLVGTRNLRRAIRAGRCRAGRGRVALASHALAAAENLIEQSERPIAL